MSHTRPLPIAFCSRPTCGAIATRTCSDCGLPLCDAHLCPETVAAERAPRPREYVAFVRGGEELARGTRDEIADALAPLVCTGGYLLTAGNPDNGLDGAHMKLSDGREVRILETAESEMAR